VNKTGKDINMAAHGFESATILLGMHRSGTSALAGVLGLCGLTVPKTMVPASETNQRGFWEPAAIKAFNDEALQRLGSTWHELFPTRWPDLGERELNHLRQRAFALLADEYERGTHILLKEPRMCRLLPLWQPVLEELANRVAYPFIIRNPVEVAKSLHERNGFDLSHGQLLWARYMLDAEFHTRGKRRAVVSYAMLLEDFRSAVTRIAKAADLPIDIAQVDVGAIDEFLAPDLRHHKELDEAGVAGEAPSVTDTYRILNSWSEGQSESAADYDKLDSLRNELDQIAVSIAGIFESARRDRKRWVDARNQVERNSSELARLRRSFEQVAKTGEEQSQKISELSRALRDRQGLESSLRDAVRTNVETLARLDGAITEAAEAAGRFAREKSGLEAERKRALDELTAMGESLEETRATLKALDAELQRTKRKFRAAQWEVEREKRAHERTRSQLATSETIVARFQSSLFWISYARLESFFTKLFSRTRGTARKRRARQLEAIERSGLFDRDWYLRTYPDVAAAFVDPLVHFYEVGWREGRDPGPDFATSDYLKANSDVARSGTNPLLHYIDFGRSEGREIRAHRGQSSSTPAPVHNFPSPAPVFSGEIVEDGPAPWKRSYRLDRSDDRLVTRSDLMVGYAENARSRAETEAAFEQLAIVSGFGDSTGTIPTDPQYGSASLVDAWYTNRSELRSRWRDECWPLVARAYQHDPLDDARLVMVGEGLLSSELDVVDFALKNPYFPVLVIFADAEGSIRGAQLMAFPSLGRGGLHYPELLATHPDAPDPIRAGLTEAARLSALRNSSNRFVKSIALDASGGDGTSPLLDPAFQQWLRHVIHVEFDQASLSERSSPERAGSGTLMLASDMIPTIRILSEGAPAVDGAGEAAFLPLLIAGDEFSQPVTMIDLPRGASMSLGMGAPGYPAPWPRFDPGQNGGLPAMSEPAAIRLPNGRKVGDSDLLVPCPGPALPTNNQSSASLTWLIWASDWQSAHLVQAIRALSLQSGADAHGIAFIGDVEALPRTVAHEFFGSRVRFFPDLSSASQEIDTDLVGHIGPAVVLHDPRSVAFLGELLADSTIASAACVLVTTEKRGKSWQASVVDGGTITLDLGDGKIASGNFVDSAWPWRATIAVSRPPRDLWIARASSVKSWIETGALEPLRKGMHVSTSLVTASYVAERVERAQEIPVPSASAGRSAKARMLFG
jgi:hypothetical protein